MNNEPIYVFMDSIDYKFLLINFAQVGNVAVLENITEGMILSVYTSASSIVSNFIRRR